MLYPTLLEVEKPLLAGDWSQCTMVLAIENKERKICKSKWLDFTHFSTNYYFFGLYCCETANI